MSLSVDIPNTASGTTETMTAGPQLGQRAFERVQSMIYRHAGIALKPGKMQMVHSRLLRRLRALRMDSFDRYLDQLDQAGADSPEWQEFVNALTTNLTSFFREQYHFPVLARHLQGLRRPGPARIWCSAASTGEEPYSIAITAADALGGRGRAADVQILATDIDTRVLEAAQRGVYPLESVERLDASMLRRHFLRGKGANEGFVRVAQDLRQLVTFRQLNLLDTTWPMRERFDAIFCRNVLIYFDKPTQVQVVRRMAGHLAPGGLLFVGHSENFTQMRDCIELIGKTVYRAARQAQGAPP